MKQEEKLTLRESIRRAAVEMDTPQYVMLDIPRVELIGDGGLLIERHHGILEYGENCICVAARDMKIKVSGMGLELRVMNRTELSIGGKICSVELIR